MEETRSEKIERLKRELRDAVDAPHWPTPHRLEMGETVLEYFDISGRVKVRSQGDAIVLPLASLCGFVDGIRLAGVDTPAGKE